MLSSRSSSSSPNVAGSATYAVRMTLRGLVGASTPRSLAAIRATKSGLAVPAPVPAKSALVGVPSRSRVPPNPYGDSGDSSSSARIRSGWSTRSCMATPAPIEWATTTGRAPGAPNRPGASSNAATSSEKSRRPRVASTGALSVAP